MAHLPAGRPIDLTCGVRYGIVAAPLPAHETSDTGPAVPPPLVVDVPEEVRRQIVEALGPSFLVFRARAQEELGLSKGQKAKLEKRLARTVQETMQFFRKLEGATPEERERQLASYRQKAQENLAAFLEGALTEGQHARLRQGVLQREGLLALMSPEIAAGLKITEKQQRQFMALVQELQKRVGAAVAAAEGNPDRARRSVEKLRRDCEGKLEAILTADQKKQWREMLGKPFALGD